MYDLIQGVRRGELFETAESVRKHTLAEAIKKVLNIDYNGQIRSDLLGGNDSGGQRGHRSSERSTASGESVESREGTADGGGSVGISDNEQVGQRNLGDTARRHPNNPPQKEIDENGHPFVVSSDGTTMFTGLPFVPIKLSEVVVDENGNGYGWQHIQARQQYCDHHLTQMEKQS